MLSVIGEAAVDTLDDNTLMESSYALSLLRRETRALQLAGWSFNTDEGLPLSPLPDGTIPLPAATLSLKFVGSDTGGYLVYRGGKVYDRVNNTFEIGRTVYADVVSLLPYEDMPEGARYFVMIRAARMFQDTNLGDSALHQFEARDELTAQTEFLSRETEDQHYNVNRDSPSVRSVTWRRQVRF